MHTELALQYAGCATSAAVILLAVSDTRTLLKHVAAGQLAQHSARFAPQRTLGPCKRHVRHGMHVTMRARALQPWRTQPAQAICAHVNYHMAAMLLSR